MDIRKITGNIFYHLHPSVLFIYFLGIFNFTFIYNHPIFMISNLICIILVTLLYTPPKKVLLSIKTALLMSIFIIVINALTNHRGANILFYLFDRPITFEAILYGILSSIMIAIMFITFLIFNVLIDSERFLYLFSGILPKLAFITNMSIRFTQVFQKRAGEILAVSTTRQADKTKLIDKIKNNVVLLEALVCFSLEEGMHISKALKSKAYGVYKRSSYNSYKFILVDLIMIIFMLFVIATSYIFVYFEIGIYNIYNASRQIMFSPLEYISYFLMLSFILLPIIVQFIATRRIKRENSRI